MVLVLVLWMKVAAALEGLMLVLMGFIMGTKGTISNINYNY